ncbi:ankyrin and armadillo repeat-containing protein-like [Spea bombifrons]|uniref:ankyrin and armadillo repeat-containing protein-like n=1 Tax=Spea bombifrons TaxID=233779 RepID=UPI00234A66A1|nr:ankyrin and armadillo repeat-containing protein-like [Spea bombifrons]
MEDLSDHGWTPIHHAAYRNHLSLVERLVETTGPEILEAVSDDSFQNTPVLLAALSGSQRMVTLLVNFGADVTFVNRQNQGVVEICALRGHFSLLGYFLNLRNPKLNVCRRLIALLGSDKDNEILGCCSAVFEMTSRVDDSEMDTFVAEGLVSGLINVLKNNFSDDVRKVALNLLKSTLRCKEAKRQILENEGPRILVSLMGTRSSQLLPVLMDFIGELASEKEFTEAYSANIIPALTQVISNTDHGNKEEVLLPVLKILGLLAVGSPVYKEALGRQAGLLLHLVQLFGECQSKALLVAWSDAVGCVSAENRNNQDTLIGENVGFYLHQMLKSKYKDVQTSAARSVCRLVEGNLEAQKAMMESGIAIPLIQLLKRSRSQHAQEDVAQTLWALADADAETQRSMAAKIGVSLLVEFLSSPSYKLNLIGAKGIGVLAQGPYDVKNSVASENGAHHLLRLLRSPRENVVLGAVRALRHICLGVGYVPNSRNQTAVANSKGLKILVGLMVRSPSRYIRVEAALAMAASVLGHPKNLDVLVKIPGFSYRHVIQLLRSPDEEVRVLAGAALATFAFNSRSQQREIAQSGGVHWGDFEPFLHSTNWSYRAHAAFQVVVLARIIPDVDPAYTSAAGIQMLVCLLEGSSSGDVVALAADCVARLSHTRAGVPAAMVSIDVVRMLCQHLKSPSDQVKGSAAIALSFLSFNHTAERQLLKRCREDPHLMKVLIYYNKKQKWSSNFLQRWNHIRELNVPETRSRKKSSSIHVMSKCKSHVECHFAPYPPESSMSNCDRLQNSRKESAVSGTFDIVA